MRRDAGFLSIAAVAMIIIFGLLSAAMVHMAVTGAVFNSNLLAATQSFDLAKSAVETGIYQLTQNPSLCTGSNQSAQSLGSGQYRFACQAYINTDNLVAYLSSQDSSLYVGDTSGFANLGFVRIDDEIIYYDGLTSNRLLSLQRGQKNTSAAAHSYGATVWQNQYLVTGQGAVPNFSSPAAQETMNQAIEYIPLLAADNAGQFYAYNGKTWAKTADQMSQAINALYCFAGNNCVAVGNGSLTYKFNGSIWSQTQDLGSNAIYALHCLSNGTCWASGANASFYYYNGSSWSLRQSLGSGINVFGLRCNAANNCRAGGSAGRFFLYNGSSWSQTQQIGSATVNGLTCTSSSSCYAVGTSGAIYGFLGSTWTTGSVGSNPINNLYCFSASNCLAVGGNGSFFAYNGSSWTQKQTIGSTFIESIQCLATNNCYAAGANASFYAYNGSSWSASQSLSGGIIMGISNLRTPAVSLIVVD